MNPDTYLETPHYRHPSGTLSSLDYEAEESSVSSMDNQSSFRTNHNNHSTTSTKQSSASTVLGYPHDSVIFDPSKKSSHPQRGLSHQYASNQTLSTFATPQGSPQSSRHLHARENPLPYSSGSEDDHDDTFASRDDDSSRSSTYRTRRDSGLPPIKLNSAKRLPPFGASTSSIPADSLIEEEEEEEEDDEGSEESQRRHLRQQQQQQHQQQQQQQQQQQKQQQKQQPQQRQYYHEDDVESIPLDDDDDEGVQIRDRDMGSRINNLPKATENGRSKQSAAQLSSQTSFHPFPSPPTRPNPPTTAPTSSQPGQQRGSHPSNSRVEPDRGPADLSNPSMALAEALIAARSKAEGKAAQQQQQQKQQQSQPSSSNDRGYGYSNNGRKVSPTTDSPGPISQVRIPVPDLSPMHGYQGHRDGTYARRTSFTLSPTSSNPELAESHSDSQSGSYGTPRPGAGARSIPSGTKFASQNAHPTRPSNASYSGDFQHHSQYRHKESSLLGTSYDSANSGLQEGETYSRFAFPGQDLDQQSLPSQGYPDHPSVYPMSGQQYRSSTGSDLENFVPKNNGKQTSNGYKASSNGQHHHHANGVSVSASGSASAYPLSASSHSLAEGEDIQDQVNTEAEYIMNRNTELLRILSIRDEEIQTLQQELDHTLKVIHEYEDDLMAMHTAAAKPYETYNQTLDQIGHEMTQQEAVLQGYKQENEKLTSQLKSSVEIRQEAEKRHLQSVDRLQTEIRQLRTDLEKTDEEKYGSSDLRAQLKQSQMDQERARKGFRDKEEEYQLEVSELKEQLRVTQQVLESERKSKVEDMQKLQKDIQDFRADYDGMLQQLEDLGPYHPHVKRGSSSSSADDGLADTTAGGELERDIGLIKAALMEKAFSTKSFTPSPPISEKQKECKPKQLDRKLTSTETLTTANMPDSPDTEKMDLEQRISKFEADVRQSLLRSASIESFISVRSSTGTVIPLATQVKPSRRPSHRKSQNGASRDDLRLSAMSEQHKLANKLRDRINSLNIENKRLHTELSSLSQVLRQQQTERQRKVSQLEELLDLHESAAAKALDDASTDEGQARIRKVIQGLLVRIRTKEAEAEFYHNAYLDKVMELDQLALVNGKNAILGEDGAQVIDNLAVSSPSTNSSSVIEGLESRVKELERLNLETAFRLTAEQRRAQATEAENATLIREKLTLARMLEDQVEQLQNKLSAAEIAKARLQDDNTLLRQGSTEKQEGASSNYASNSNGNNNNNNAANAESLSIMRTRMLSLTRQRDQLREQLQEAFDIQLTMQDRAAGGVPEWSVDDYKRLERALEEKTNELGVWKERAIALEKVVERIRMIKDKPEPTGLSLDRSSRSITDSESIASSGPGSGRHPHQHTLEELDQVVLRLEQRLERRDQELQEVVLEAKRQTDLRLEAWKAKWVQVVQRKNAEIHRFQVELESLMAAVDRDRARMAASMKK